MTIQEIKERTIKTEPYFFSRETMKFFNQTMNGFTIEEVEGRYRISQAIRDSKGQYMGETVRYFNPDTNRLDRE